MDNAQKVLATPVARDTGIVLAGAAVEPAARLGILLLPWAAFAVRKVTSGVRSEENEKSSRFHAYTGSIAHRTQPDPGEDA